MRKCLLLCSILVLFGSAEYCYGQEGGDYEYSREIIWGITKATHSGLIGGFIFKYNLETKEDVFHGISVEVVNIKHPQERRIYSIAGNGFIAGKEHYLYNFRIDYNREYTFFKKASQQGVQVNGVLAAGPAIGIEAPYYLEINQGGGYVKKEAYDHTNPNHRYDNILGTGGILQGLCGSSIVPGLNLKAALAFEFGTFKSNVVGVEIGFQVDAFTREINMLPTTESSYSVFPSAFATLFYGSRK